MRILGVDTSTKYTGIAIIEDGKLIAESIMQFMASHSEKLLPEIAHILEMTQISIESIDYYAVTVGPGSFTGLRVAVSTLKGLAFVTNKKIISVSTLEVIARGFPYCKYQICPMLDARKKEVFAALFKWGDGELLRVKEDAVLGVDSLKEWINEKTVFIGSGAELYKERLIENFGNKAIFATSVYDIPRAATVAFIGIQKIKNGELIDARDLKPMYFRKSEAEIKFKCL